MKHRRVDLVIFDLDGTLIDSRLDLAHAVNATRDHMGLGPLEHEKVFSYVGSGAPVLIRRVLGPDASEQDVQEALEFFLEYYRDHMLDFTHLYSGVWETLGRLSTARIIMAVLTNKPVRFSKSILDGLGASSYFRQVYGGNSFNHKKPHPIGVETLLAENEVSPERTIMVGDSDVDILTARNAGVLSCGVSYGFQPETLSALPPDLLVDKIEELADWAIGAPNGSRSAD